MSYVFGLSSPVAVVDSGSGTDVRFMERADSVLFHIASQSPGQFRVILATLDEQGGPDLDNILATTEATVAPPGGIFGGSLGVPASGVPVDTASAKEDVGIFSQILDTSGVWGGTQGMTFKFFTKNSAKGGAVLRPEGPASEADSCVRVVHNQGAVPGTFSLQDIGGSPGGVRQYSVVYLGPVSARVKVAICPDAGGDYHWAAQGESHPEFYWTAS